MKNKKNSKYIIIATVLIIIAIIIVIVSIKFEKNKEKVDQININASIEYDDGAIFSKDDLTINGTGTLNVNANYLDGIVSKDELKIIGTTINVISNDDGIRGKDYIGIKEANIAVNANSDGIKSTNDTDEAKGFILIDNGNFNIDSSDDSIHSNGNIIINNGTFEIASGDDGIHADESITINDGIINISKSYEGIESSKIDINGGNINLVSSDDGINIAGGNDSSSINGRPGQNNFSSNSDQTLTINNGYIVIDATGDGIDINGAGYINGGTVVVNGPTNSGNGALDYDSVFQVNGGTLIAVGASGMMQTPSSDSSIYSISYVYSNTQQANTKVTIKNSDDEEIISYTPSKNYESVIISTEQLKKGETYTIYSNEETVQEITINNIVTSVGNSNSGIQGGGMNKGQMQENPGERMMH